MFVEEYGMNRRRVILLASTMIILTILAITAALFLCDTEQYPGMVRISSQVAQGNKTNGDHYIELPGLQAGQLVVIEADSKSGVTSSWIKHSSTETFVVEGRGFENGKLEYEVTEDADYTFQLNCDNAEFKVSINVWENAE